VTDRYSTLRLGLVGAWCPSLGGGAALLRDRSGRGCHATPEGTSYVAMPSGVTFALPGGTAASANSATAAAAVVGLTRATISVWLWKANSTHIIGAGFATGASNVGNRFGFIWWSDGNTYCSFSNANSHSAAVPSTTGWLHIAMVYDGNQANASRVQVFFNGRPASMTTLGTAPTALASALGTLYLGRDASERVCQGRVDDARVYSRALTAAEIGLLASQRGIGLSPTRHRRARLASAATTMFLNVGGTWKAATPKTYVGGTWTTATPKVNVGGVWKG